MKHTTILKRPDGTKIAIDVTLYINNLMDEHRYDISISKCAPRKRTYYYVNNTDDYTWRKLSIADRQKATMAEYLKHVTAEEILAAKIDLWNAIKPTL